MTKLVHRAQLFLAVVAVASGQVKTPKNNRYETVSIKRGVKGKPRGVHFSALEFRLENWSLRDVIGSVYNAQRGYSLVGLPKWASSESFSFRARSIAPANPPEQWAMLRPVLEDRLRLKYHREKRQMPVYFLSPAEGGVQFRATVSGICAPIDRNVGPPPSEQPLRPGEPPSACGVFLNQVLPGGGMRLTVRGITMADLAGALGAYLDRPMVERRGSSNRFDVDLSFMRDDLAVSDPSAEPSNLPSIFTALKKGGLSVTSGKDAVDVLVIDQLERPSEN